MLLPLLLVLHFGLAAALVYGSNRLGLIPWHKARTTHWTVRARLLWPARKANALFVIAVPAALGAAQLFFLPELPLTWLFAALAGVFGAIPGMWPMVHAVFPELRWARWLRDFGATFLVRLLTLGVWFTAAFCMPYHLGPATVLITAGVVVFVLWLNRGGILWLLRVTGFLAPAPPHLAAIVSEVAARMNLPLPRLGLLRTYGANAVAFPVIHTLLVTEGALNALPDDELAAVCAHEFAHLCEPRGVILARLLTAFLALPGIFFKPAVEAWGSPGFVAICAVMFLFSRVTIIFRRRMEKRADSVATAHEGLSPGTYARALERLYEINLVPAVISGLLTHPNLYDRLLAAGVTPSYPRPPAPPRFSWQLGWAILLLAAAVIAVVFRIEYGD